MPTPPRRKKDTEQVLQPEGAHNENLQTLAADLAAAAVSPGEEVGVRADFALSMLRDVEVLTRPLDFTNEIITPDIKAKMMLDAVINSTLHWLTDAALDSGIKHVPAVRNKESPDYKDSQRVYDMCMRCMDASLDEVLASYGSMTVEALSLGSAIGEKIAPVCEHRGHGLEPGWRELAAVKHRDPEVVAFVVDPHMNTLGIAARTVKRRRGALDDPPTMRELPPRGDGGLSNIISSGVEGGVDEMGTMGLPPDWRMFPRAKWAVMSNRAPHGDPRGVDLLRHIYNEWYLIQAIWPHYLKFLMKFASPSIKGKLGDKAGGVRTVNGKRVDPLDELYGGLRRFENSSIIALRHGSDAELMYSQGEGNAFQLAIGILERRIIRGLTNQVLANSETRNGSRAQAQTHQDQQNVVVRGIKRMNAKMHRRDILEFLVRINMGEQFVRLTPMCQLGGVAPEDQAAAYTAVSGLWQSGYLQESQIRELDAGLGLPYRETPEPGFYPSSATSKKNFEAAPVPATQGTKPVPASKPKPAPDPDDEPEDEE